AAPRTTLVYRGLPGGYPTYIQSSAGLRTTYYYDTSNNIRRIQDAAGRITSLSVNSTNSTLTRMITPDGQRTTLSGKLSAVISPTGARTTFTYAGSTVLTGTFPTLWQAPGGQRTSYAFSGTQPNQPIKVLVTSPAGKRTTLAYVYGPPAAGQLQS